MQTAIQKVWEGSAIKAHYLEKDILCSQLCYFLEQISNGILPVIRFTTTLEILEATNDSYKAKKALNKIIHF